MRYAWILVVLAGAVALVVPQAEARRQKPDAPKFHRPLGRHLLGTIELHRNETWRWQRLMGHPRSPYADSAAQSQSRRYRRWVLGLWRERAERAFKLARKPPHRREWLCIHRYEGSWTDPNSPYYGGLQMDLEFQSTYGPELLRRKGTADNWTPLEQMWVAERAFRSGRGFYPWPNTARYCGLI